MLIINPLNMNNLFIYFDKGSFNHILTYSTIYFKIFKVYWEAYFHPITDVLFLSMGTNDFVTTKLKQIVMRI